MPRSPRQQQLRRACAVLELARADLLSSTGEDKHKQRARLLWGRGCDIHRRHPRANLEWTRKLGRASYPRPWFCRTVEHLGSQRCHHCPDLLLPPPGQGDLHPSGRMDPDHPLHLGAGISARRIGQGVRKIELRDKTPVQLYPGPRKPRKSLRWGPGDRVRRARRPTPMCRSCWSARWPAPASQLAPCSACAC